MYRLHPQWQLVKKLIGEGEIGEVRAVQAWFSYHNVNPATSAIWQISAAVVYSILAATAFPVRGLFSTRNRNEWWGMSSSIRSSRRIAWRRPYSISARPMEIPLVAIVQRTATFICGTQMAPNQFVMAGGTEGRIEIEWPFTAPPDRPAKICCIVATKSRNSYGSRKSIHDSRRFIFAGRDRGQTRADAAGGCGEEYESD